ncbi:MAG TPA: uracil-DNA glycosylase [Candidatus Hydrogenedentes bacterium]|nr:uracil-DNA glycosylase [Candidatus Hydrogenedentota bacterium]
MSNQDTLKSVLNDVCELVRRNARGKNRTIAVSPEVADRLNRIPSAPVRKPNVPANPVLSKASAPKPSGVWGPIPPEIQDLGALERYMMDCHACPLGATRTRLVFGAGNPRAELVFVGEAPGAEEDRQGKPFVGRAGQLLTDIIEKGMNLQRAEVYICNVLKCRPPDNRNPLPGEVEQCEPYLIRQLEIIRPKVICTLGTYATQTLLKTVEPIGRLRGRWHFYHGIPLRATYHPAYLLRNPVDKRKTWEDVLEVLKVYRGEFTPGP